MMLDDPVDPGDHSRGGSTPETVENPHRNDSRRWGDTIRGASDRPRHMGAVTVAIIGVSARRHHVETRLNASREFGVRSDDTGVDDVDIDPLTP